MQGTILVIDGVSTNRIVLKVQLTAACFQVLQADSVASAVQLAEGNQPDLILTAMTLPDGDAGAVKRALARLPHLADVPVIALSAQNDRVTRLTALAVSIDEVLPLPVDDMILQARIRSLLRMRLNDADLHLREEGAPLLPIASRNPPLHRAPISASPWSAPICRPRINGRAAWPPPPATTSAPLRSMPFRI